MAYDKKVTNTPSEQFEPRIENVYSAHTSQKGIAGFLEYLLRRFRVGAFVAALIPVYFLGIIAMGISAAPGIFLFDIVQKLNTDWPATFQYISLGITLFTAYLLYGLTLIFVVPFFNFILPFRIKPFRGSYFSLQSVPWYVHNAFTYIVRYTFLEFITPTPMNILFYRLMGMKIGKGVHINTTNISDPGLIEIGDRVTIGGSAHLMAHYGQKGYLVLSRLKIENGVTIGLKATIMGNVEIGKGAVIGPHEVVYPKSRIPAGRKPLVNGVSAPNDRVAGGAGY
ncbi:MAG TPA: hypothetical protein EYP36_12165 [Calditrichaeota bacterium]|nr:hypothetical protein [Calditrichota bacterium]